VLAVAMALGLAGTAPADELYGTLKKIKETGVITIGHNSDSPPFSFIGPDGKPQGYSIDLCMKIVDGVKEELKLDKLDVKFVSVIGTTRIPLLVNGTTDLNCATTTNTLTRQRQVDFLDTMFITGNRILVKKGSGIKEVEDLKGKRVSVNQGTTNEKIIKDLDAKLHLGINFLDTKDQPQAFLALETGRTDAHVTDEIVEYGLIAKARNPEQYEVVGRLLSYDPYAILIRRDDSAFRLVGNRVLAGLFRSGEINAIYDKWLLPVHMPMSDMLKTVFAAQAVPE
jgi:glutamate/aspartate transport system substrate-binding protein